MATVTRLIDAWHAELADLGVPAGNPSQNSASGG
jgi:hypothetical protein